jgi:hypothetical protein
MNMGSEPFWKAKTPAEMTHEEWESLCDGCGRCCLHKFEDENTGKVYYTSVACRLLDTETCRCRDYENRHRLVPDCRVLTPDKINEFKWLPSTCAYRRVAEGKELEWWHPLVSGTTETVHQADISVRDKIISEKYVDENQLEAYIIVWDVC